MLFLINLKIKCVTVAAQRMDGEMKVLYLQYSYITIPMKQGWYPLKIVETRTL